MKTKSMWRTIWLYVITSILLVSITVAFSFSIYINGILEKNAESSFYDLSDRIAQSAASFLRETELLALTMARNTTLIDIMLKPNDYPLSQQYDDYFALRAFLSNNNYQQIDSCRLAFHNSAFYTREKQSLFSIESPMIRSLLYEVEPIEIDYPRWVVHNGAIRYIQPVHNYIYSTGNIGLILLDISRPRFSAIFSNVQSLENACFELFFNDQFVCAYGQSASSENAALQRTVDLRSGFSLRFSSTGLSHALRLGQALTSVVPWVLVCCVFIFFLITKIAKGFYRNISLLSASISAIDPMSSRELNLTKYSELNIVVEHFNRMLDHIRRKFKEESEEHDKQRVLSLQMLESQINPHFLYNSLDVINWLAWQQGAEDVATLSRSLGTFYRDALSKTTNENTLAKELAHVNTYLEIMNLRMEDVLFPEIDIPGDLMNNVLPRLSLQPMMENAFQHGVLNKPGCPGAISLCARKQGDVLEITVRDNGPGMSPEKLEAYLNTLSVWPPKEMHGLINIHHRTRLLYGENYGISLRSVENSYFEAILTVPIREFKPRETFQDQSEGEQD